MSKLMRRLATTTAFVAVAGGAMLGAGGAASAATLGTDQHHWSPAISVNATGGHQIFPGSNGGQHIDSSDSGRASDDHGRDYGWDGHHGWHNEKNHSGNWYWYSDDHGRDYRWDGHHGWRNENDHSGNWYWYRDDHGRDYRWNGHHPYHRNDGQ
jgi:hypothetical protein